MKKSDINHLRRLLGWVRTEIGQAPDELVETMRVLGTKLQPELSDAAKQRLVESHDRARSVPKYVREAERALSKMLDDRGEVVDAAANEQPRIGNNSQETA